MLFPKPDGAHVLHEDVEEEEVGGGAAAAMSRAAQAAVEQLYVQLGLSEFSLASFGDSFLAKLQFTTLGKEDFVDGLLKNWTNDYDQGLEKVRPVLRPLLVALAGRARSYAKMAKQGLAGEAGDRVGAHVRRRRH